MIVGPSNRRLAYCLGLLGVLPACASPAVTPTEPVAVRPAVATSETKPPAVAPTPVVAEAPAPAWLDITVEADWIAFRSDTALFVGRHELGIAEYDPSTGRLVKQLELPANAGSPAAWSPAAGLLAFDSGTIDRVIVRSLAGGAPDREITATQNVMALSPTGDRLATTYSEPGKPPRLEIFATATGKRLTREQPFGRAPLEYDSGFRLQVAFVGDGVALLLANDTPPEATLMLRTGGKKWRRIAVDFGTAEDEAFEFNAAPRLGEALVVSPDGATIAAGNFDDRVFLVKVGEDRKPTTLRTDTTTVTALAYAPDGTWLAAAGQEGPLHVLAMPGGATLAKLEAPKRCTVLALAPDGRRLAGACDHVVRVWNVNWPSAAP